MLWEFSEKSDFQEEKGGKGGHEKPIYRRRNCLKKRGAWTVCIFKGDLGKKEGGGVFDGGG